MKFLYRSRVLANSALERIQRLKNDEENDFRSSPLIIYVPVSNFVMIGYLSDDLKIQERNIVVNTIRSHYAFRLTTKQKAYTTA